MLKEKKCFQRVSKIEILISAHTTTERNPSIPPGSTLLASRIFAMVHFLKHTKISIIKVESHPHPPLVCLWLFYTLYGLKVKKTN